MKLGHSNKNSIKKSRRKTPQGKILEFFSQIPLKLHFEWQIQPKDGHNQGIFSPKSGHFF